MGTALRPRERMRSRLRFSHSGTNEALTLPALKRVIRVEALSRTAKALLPPHKCGGFHSILNRQRSCSRYLIWQTISFPRSALMASRGATFEPLLSIITFSGAPFRSIACSKKLRAATLSRRARSRKSMVSPALSMARYRFFQSALELKADAPRELHDSRQVVLRGNLRSA